MARVTHIPKNRGYDYPDARTAEEHCKQAVEQSGGRLVYKRVDEDTFVIDASRAKGER